MSIPLSYARLDYIALLKKVIPVGIPRRLKLYSFEDDFSLF